MIQVDSAFSIQGTRRELKHQMPYLHFKGTGLYRRPTGFILIIPRDPQEDGQAWKVRDDWPIETIFRVYYYLCPKKSTLFQFIPKGVIPMYSTNEET